MTTLDWISRLFDAVFWADGRALESLDPHNPVGRRYFNHILAAERVWLMRLRGQNSGGQEIWPDLTHAEALSLMAENQDGYRRYLAELQASDLGRSIEYANQTGRRFNTAVGDILIHVATHGAYHRGQIARDLREAALSPVNTDYIMYVRQMGGAGSV